MEDKLLLLFELLLQCSEKESQWLLAVMGTEKERGTIGDSGIHMQ